MLNVLETLFVWEMSDEDLDNFPHGWINFLARSPGAFLHSGSIMRFPALVTLGWSETITSHGLSLRLPILHNALEEFGGASAVALLHCISRQDGASVGIFCIACTLFYVVHSFLDY